MSPRGLWALNGVHREVRFMQIQLHSTCGNPFQRPAAIDVANTNCRLFGCCRLVPLFASTAAAPRSYDPDACRSLNPAAQQRTQGSGQCIVTAFSPSPWTEFQDSLQRRFPTAQHRNPGGSSESTAGRSCDGLPNACQIAHNEERLAKNGGERWWRVGRDTRSTATRDNHESHLFC
jgi:hypothetical protein